MTPDADSPVSLTAAAAQRVGRAVLRHERAERSRENLTPLPPGGERPQPPPVWVVRVTGGVAANGLYPAVVRELTLSGGGPAWQDAAGEEPCWAYHVAGEDLADGDKGIGLCVEADPDDGRTVFAVSPWAADPPAPPALATRNLDGTESGTTTDLRFDQATGAEIQQGLFGGGPYDTVRLRAATDTQMGAVTVLSQVWDGAKIGRGTRAGQPGDDSRFPAGVTVCWGAANGRDAGASPSHWVGASDTSAGVVVHEAEGFTTADESIGLMLSRYGGTSGGFPFWRYSAVTVRFWPHPEYDDAVVPVVFAGDPVVPDGLSADDPVRNPCFGVTRPANSTGSGLVAINAGVYLGIDDGEMSPCAVYQLVGGIITGRSTVPTTTPQATDYVTICRNGRAYRVTMSQISTLMQALAAPG